MVQMYNSIYDTMTKYVNKPRNDLEFIRNIKIKIFHQVIEP